MSARERMHACDVEEKQMGRRLLQPRVLRAVHRGCASPLLASRLLPLACMSFMRAVLLAGL